MKNACIILVIISTIFAQTGACASHRNPLNKVMKKDGSGTEEVSMQNPLYVDPHDDDLLVTSLYEIARKQGALELRGILKCRTFTSKQLEHALQLVCQRTDYATLSLVKTLLEIHDWRGSKIEVNSEGTIAKTLRAAAITVTVRNKDHLHLFVDHIEEMP